MKFGCCLNMVSTKPDGTGAEWIAELKNSGFDYAELPLSQMMDLSEDDFDQIRNQLLEVGIPCDGCNNFFPASIRLTGEEADPEKALSYADRALGRAQDLGAKYVAFGSGGAKKVPEGFPIEKGYRQLVELTKDLGVLAGQHGILIVIEPLRKAECNLVNNFKEGVRLAKDVDDPNVRVLIDLYQMTEEGEPASDLLQDGKEYLRHVHFANPNGRFFPKVLQEADYQGFAEVLRKIGYDGRISCEASAPEGFRKDAPLTREFFSELFEKG